MIRSLWGVVLGLFVLLLTACGGGGSDPGECVIGCSGGVDPVVDVAELRIALSANTIDLTSPSPVTVTVTAVSSSNLIVPNAPVKLTVSNEGSVTVESSKTDSSGKLVGLLEIGGNKSVRTMVVTATSGSITKSVNVAVVEGQPSAVVADLRISLSSLTIDANSPSAVAVTVTAVDSNNIVIANAPVLISADKGGVITANKLTTDANGVLTASLEIGADRSLRSIIISASSGRIIKTAVVSVVDKQPSAPVADLRINLSSSTIDTTAPSPISVSITAVNASNQIVTNAPVLVSVANSGVITTSSAVTDATGNLQATLELGENKVPRVLVVSATSGAITKTALVSVVQGRASSDVSDLRIALSSSVIDLAAPAPVAVTVTAVNSSNQVVSNAPAILSVSDDGVITAGGTATNAAGVLTGSLLPGSSKLARTMTVTVTSGAVTRTAIVNVIDSTLTSTTAELRIALSSSSIDLASPKPISVTVTAVNSSNQVVPNAPVTLSVANGGLLTTSASRTNASGQLVGILEVGDNRAARTMTVTAISGAIVRNTQVSVVDGSPSSPVEELRLSFSSPTISNKAPTAVEVTVTAVNAVNLPVSGAPVTIRADQGGVITSSALTTDTTGNVKATLGMGTNTTPRVITVTASSGTKLGTGSVTVVDGFNAKSATLTVQLSNVNVTNASTSTATATLLDASGQPVPNSVVSFSTQGGLGRFSALTALTDNLGKATTVLSPATATSAGADYVQASARVNGSDLTSVAGFSVQPTPVQIQSLTSDLASIGAYGQTNITAVLSGVVAGTPITLQASSQCEAAGKATISPTLVTTTTGNAVFVLKDNQCGVNSAKDVVTVTIVGGSSSQSVSIPVASPAAASLAYVSAVPNVIYLKGSGFDESSLVTFQVRDNAGNPLPNVPVSLSLVNATGGVSLDGGTAPRNSDNNGQVSARVISGTVPTPIRVRAELTNSPVVNTVSSGLSVAVGLPAQQNFSLSQGSINIEGLNLDGVTNSYTIIASDRLGNPVPDNTAINFVAEGGQIVASAFTRSIAGLSSATATFQSSAPRPNDGRITILAYAIGEESFIDLNGNNTLDSGEPFQDLGDPFVSRGFTTNFNPLVDQTFSFASSASNCAVNNNPLLPADASIPSIASRCDGVFGRNFVRRSVETILSSSSPAIYIRRTGPGAAQGIPGGASLDSACAVRSISTSSDGSSSSQFFVFGQGGIWGMPLNGSLSLLLADDNLNRLNPMPAGTEVSVSATDGLSVKVLGGTPVVSTSQATNIAISVGFSDTTFGGTVFVTTKSPKGLSTSVPLFVSRNAVPAACTQ